MTVTFADTRVMARTTQAWLTDNLARSGAPGQASSPITGFIWVTLAMLAFSGLGAFAKAAISAGVPPLEVIFLRNLFCVALLSPLLLTRGTDLVRVSFPKLYGVRILLAFVSMTAWFLAIAMIPFTELTAVGFLAPLFATLFAVLYLGEIVRARRWTALAVGFIGAMIILRPGSMGFGWGQVLAVVAALTSGIIGPLLKQLSKHDDADKIVFCSNLGLVPLSLIPALFVWQWPTAEAWPVLIAMGVCAVLGHISLMRGFASTDASLVSTFEFSRLPFAALVGWFAFGEHPDVWTIVGALTIFASAAYITRREAQVAAQRSGRIRSRTCTDPLGLTPVAYGIGG
jgi:drug/metabolite transporter (DMT)-like permease